MAYNPNNPNGQATMANSQPMVIASDQTPIPINGNPSSLQTGSWTSATSLNTAVSMTVSNYNTVSVAVIAGSTITAGAITFEVSMDNTNWVPIQLGRIDSFNVDSVYTLVASTNRAWTGSVDAFIYFRVRLSTAITGTGTVAIAMAAQTLPIEPVITIGQANGSLLNTTLTPGTTGGLSVSHLVSAASTNATNVKASPGQVFGWYIYNSNTSAARKVAFHNTSGTPTAGSGVVFAIVIPPLAGANVFSETGITFSTGIAFTTVTDLTDAGTTAVAASDLIINIFYK